MGYMKLWVIDPGTGRRPMCGLRSHDGSLVAMFSWVFLHQIGPCGSKDGRITLAAVRAAAGLVQAAEFTLVSPEVKADAVIPKRFEFKGFGCAGENKSPVVR